MRSSYGHLVNSFQFIVSINFKVIFKKCLAFCLQPLKMQTQVMLEALSGFIQMFVDTHKIKSPIKMFDFLKIHELFL